MHCLQKEGAGPTLMCRQACASILAHFSDSISEEKLISQASIKNKRIFGSGFKGLKLMTNA